MMSKFKRLARLTNLLVGVLAGQTLGNAGHDDVLTGKDCQKRNFQSIAIDSRGHEGKLIIDVALDDLGVDNEAGADVVEEDETGIRSQVQLGNADTADGAVIEGSLEPLGGVGVQTILGEVLQVTTQGAQTLRAHGVTLVGLPIVSRGM